MAFSAAITASLPPLHAADVTLLNGTYTDTQTYNNGVIGQPNGHVVTFGSGANYTFDSLSVSFAWNRMVLNSGASLNMGGNLSVDLSGVSLNGGTLTAGGLQLHDGPDGWDPVQNDGKQTIQPGDSIINGSTIIANQSNANFISFVASSSAPWANEYLANNLWLGNDGATINSNGFEIGVSMALKNFSGQTGSLTKTGAGTLTLSGSNTYTGGTAIWGGTLEFASGSLNSTGYVNLLGGTLRWASGNSDALGNIYIFNGYTGTLDTNGNHVTLGAIQDNGANHTGNLVKTGAGVLTFTGINSYTGGTTVNAGTLELAGAQYGNGLLRGAVTVNSGSTVAITGGDGTGFGWNDPITNLTINSGSVNATGGSHIGFASTSTTVSLNNGGTIAGNWQWNGDDRLAFSSSGDSTNTLSGNLVLRSDNGANHTFDVANGAAAIDLQITANLSDQYPEVSWNPASALVKVGAGTMVLSGTNSYHGGTTVSDGALQVTAGGSLLFGPTTNGTSNAVSGSATASLSFLGTVSLDLTAADATIGNSWNLFNLGSFTGPTPLLNPAAVTTTTLGSFTQVSPGVWELPVTGAKWTFSTATGNLAYVNAASPYETWGAAYGLTAGSETDDLDGDGITNFQEYAFGLIPNSGSSVNPIAVQLDKATGTFSYTRRQQSLTGLTHTVWVSTNLATWTQDAGAVQGTPVLNGEVETVPVTVSAALLASPKLFIQVRAN